MMSLATNSRAQDSDEAQEARRVAEAQRAQAISEQHHNAARIRQLTQELEARQKELEATHRAMEAEQKAFRQGQDAAEAMRRAAQKAQKEAESGRPDQLKAAALKRAQIELEEARAQLAFMHERIARGKQAPLPENAQTRVFALRHGKAPDLTSVLSEILGNEALRMGVDQRSNSLIVSADDKSLDIVEALLQKLDQPAGTTNERAATETLQLRVIWLLDQVEGKEPTDNLVSPQVVEALHQLGFEDPRVVCQQVTTLTLGDNRRAGRFQFAVPVLIDKQLWQLGGSGLVTPAGDDRFSLQFELEVEQQDNPQKGRLGGSIYSPLGHYTVMGTTTFVATNYMPAEGGGTTTQQAQHLSAFVVYLDRAPEFPAGKVLGEKLKKANSEPPTDQSTE